MAYKGVYGVAFAHGTYNDGQAPVYANGKMFSELCSVDENYTYSNASVYANNAKALSDRRVTGGTVSINVLSLDDDAEVDVLGYAKASDGTIEVTDAETPIGGLGFVTTEEDENGDSYVSTVLYKTQFSLASKSINTRGEDTEFQTPTLEGDLMGIINDDTTTKKFEAHKRFTSEADALAWVKTQLNIQ